MFSFPFETNFKQRMDVYLNIGMFVFKKQTNKFFTLTDIKFSDHTHLGSLLATWCVRL